MSLYIFVSRVGGGREMAWGRTMFWGFSKNGSVAGGSNEKASFILHRGIWQESRVYVSTKVDAVSARCPNKVLVYARHCGLKSDFIHVSADLPNSQSMIVRPFEVSHRIVRPFVNEKSNISISPPPQHVYPHRHQNASPPQSLRPTS